MKTIDPVCKMTIEEEDATGTSSHNGSTYHFCSPSCKVKFDKNPDTFTGDTVSGPEKETSAKGETFTCPMHPEVRQEGPGSCPKCGMALNRLSLH